MLIVEELVKQYGDFVAADSVSFVAEKGTVILHVSILLVAAILVGVLATR